MANIKYIQPETENISLHELRSILEGVIEHIEGKTISINKFNELARYSRREGSKESRKSTKVRTRWGIARG